MPTARTKLLGGPYQRPDVRIGDRLRDRRLGPAVVADFTRAKIPWPARLDHGLLVPILTGDLVLAVRKECVAAVAASWGVSRYTVRRWRRCLEVPQFNAGTRQLWRTMASRKLNRAARKLGGRNSRRALRARDT